MKTIDSQPPEFIFLDIYSVSGEAAEIDKVATGLFFEEGLQLYSSIVG